MLRGGCWCRHAQAVCKVEGVSVLPGHSRCTAHAALGLWLGLQVAVLLVGKLYMSDEALAPADSGTRPDSGFSASV